jgi:hypothetical protein
MDPITQTIITLAIAGAAWWLGRLEGENKGINEGTAMFMLALNKIGLTIIATENEIKIVEIGETKTVIRDDS